jgi:hypothetical protein
LIWLPEGGVRLIQSLPVAFSQRPLRKQLQRGLAPATLAGIEEKRPGVWLYALRGLPDRPATVIKINANHRGGFLNGDAHHADPVRVPLKITVSLQRG